MLIILPNVPKENNNKNNEIKKTGTYLKIRTTGTKRLFCINVRGDQNKYELENYVYYILHFRNQIELR